MRKQFIIPICFIVYMCSCSEILEPEPQDLLTDDVVLNEAKDLPNALIGLYASFRGIMSQVVIAGDFTADNLIHNGTFSQYRELGLKRITPVNSSAAAYYGGVYRAVYVANFILERLPDLPGVSSADRLEAEAISKFIRGLSYFYGLNTFGRIPLVTTTSFDENLDIPRADESEILALIQSDLEFALGKITDEPANAGFASDNAVRAILARFHLYQQNWTLAESFATSVIESGDYELETSYSEIVLNDLTDESIFEVVYQVSDDPGTNSTSGLNNLFVGRREIIPSNDVVQALFNPASGDRFSSIDFDPEELVGNDNGWTVLKYGTPDEGNNDIVVVRLAEMYLIRAEARARAGNVSGAGSAQDDINVLRARANAPLLGTVTQNQMLQIVEEERRYELAFEGHRWYDLVRTGRISTVMSAFSPNWEDTYNLWPIPQREIQNNPSLGDDQNPGY